MERRKRRSDMLSVLPDEVLCHILSFLSTRLSVRTSVLSKRWRFLWAHVPNLEFDRHTFRGTTVTKRQHLDIISRVVALHQAQTLNTFKLSKLKTCASSSSSSYRLHTLIINLVTKRNLRNLHLDLGVPCTLPRHFFACKTLVELELLSCGLIPSSGELIFLPSLKKLNLSCVEYEDDESLPHLLSGCPVLEELTVKVGKDNPGSVIVSSSTVEKLTVDFSLLAEEDCPDEMLVIDVPALGYLKVDRCNLDSCRSLEKTMTSLVEAEITLNGYSHTCADDCTEHGRAIAFVSCLCNARCLKISTDFAETLVDIVGTRWMPKFVNLTKLELVLIVNWYNVVKFLQFADNLEALTISLYEMPSYAEPRRVPPCMVSRLRTVTMYCFSPCEDAFETVRYVLKNARALERMEIYSQDGSSDKEDLDALRKISLFERGSASCQLDFNDVD